MSAQGSADSFHVSTRCGLRPKARQFRDTDDCDRPVSAAIVRVDQCVSCPGVLLGQHPGDRSLAMTCRFIPCFLFLPE
jgi:hypothetical protein